MRNRKFLVAAALGLVAILALVALLPSHGSAPRTRVAESANGLRVRWPSGQRFLYSLSWHARTAGVIAPGGANQQSTQLNLEAAVEGEIALERAGGTDALPMVALAYTRFDKFSFDMQGQSSQAQTEQIQAALAGQTAYLAIDERGRVGSISFPPRSIGAASVLRSLALQLGYTLPAGDEPTWEADEGNSLGEAHVRYQRGSPGSDDFARAPTAFTRLDVVRGPLDGKQDVSGGAVIAVDSNGLPTSIDETVDATYTPTGSDAPAVHSGWTFSLARKQSVADTRFAAGMPKATPQALRAQVDDPDRDKRHDQHMAQGMSTDDVLLMFSRFESGTRPGHQFLVRAASWLRLHPEDLKVVLAKFQGADLSVKGRGLILDVLAETGTPAAQAAMRQALLSSQAHAKPHDFSQLVQRFTFVLAPDAASIQFLEGAYDAQKRAGGDVESTQGTAVALGSAVRRLTVQHELASANEINERLRGELQQAQTPEMKAALVAALGNAARADDVPDIAAAASDSDLRVRDQVANALRSVDSQEARQTLFTLVADSSTGVANAALDALHSQTLGDSDWQSLQQIAQQGSSPVSSDAALLNLVKDKDKTAARPEARQILTALLARNQGGDNDLPGLIRNLLATQN